MNFGKTIQELRKQKNITQEELAAELGVTAAAVSKWENNYTLPDILMLCALADYFQVTTDELLGRNLNIKYAVIAASSPELCEDIQRLAKSHGFVTKHMCQNYFEALEAVKADKSISHLFVSMEKPMVNEEKKGDEFNGIRFIESQSDNRQNILEGFNIYFNNMSVYDALAESNKD